MDRAAKDIIMKPMTFYIVMFVVLLVGMMGSYAIGYFFPGTLFGLKVAESDAATATRIAKRMQNMMKSRRQNY